MSIEDLILSQLDLSALTSKIDLDRVAEAMTASLCAVDWGHELKGDIAAHLLDESDVISTLSEVLSTKIQEAFL